MASSLDEKKRWTILERYDGDWILSERLFGTGMIDINDFEPYFYVHFLDNVSCLDDLIVGLQELSPFVDDALCVAENMDEKEFRRFKSALKKERVRKSESTFPKNFRTIVLPSSFLTAGILSEEYAAPLGVALFQFHLALEKLLQPEAR